MILATACSLDSSPSGNGDRGGEQPDWPSIVQGWWRTVADDFVADHVPSIIVGRFYGFHAQPGTDGVTAVYPNFVSCSDVRAEITDDGRVDFTVKGVQARFQFFADTTATVDFDFRGGRFHRELEKVSDDPASISCD